MKGIDIIMVLEYRTNDCTWNMVESPKMSFCRFYVEEDIIKISEKKTSNWGDFRHEIYKFLKGEYIIKAGYAPEFRTELHVENKENLSEIKEIIMIVVIKPRGTEIHFFDSDFPFYICCNDGSIFRESEHFII